MAILGAGVGNNGWWLDGVSISSGTVWDLVLLGLTVWLYWQARGAM